MLLNVQLIYFLTADDFDEIFIKTFFISSWLSVYFTVELFMLYMRQYLRKKSPSSTVSILILRLFEKKAHVYKFFPGGPLSLLRLNRQTDEEGYTRVRGRC